MANPYLMSMGAETITRAQFLQALTNHSYTPSKATWQIDSEVDLSRWEPEAAN